MGGVQKQDWRLADTFHAVCKQRLDADAATYDDNDFFVCYSIASA
jgi:hypothetical protein